jgi:hypothetical protein
MKGSGKQADPVVQRLDVIIGLLLRSLPGSENERPTAEQIRALKDMDVDNVTIGRIVGKAPNYVSAVVGRRTRSRRGSTKRKVR